MSLLCGNKNERQMKIDIPYLKNCPFGLWFPFLAVGCYANYWGDNILST